VKILSPSLRGGLKRGGL
jgi:hypothetical protein